MRISETQKNIGIICGISGAVQGLTWTILSLIAIIAHYSPPTLSTSSTFAEQLNRAIYMRFIYKNTTNMVEAVVRPADFVVFMFFYLFLSALWFVVSTAQLVVLISIKKRESMLMTANGLVMLGISIIDIILWGLLVRDYVDCYQLASDGSDIWCYTTTGIIMTLAIRGYALWFINIVFSYLLIWNGINNARSIKHWADRNIGSIPRAKLQNDYRNPEPIYSDDPMMGDRRGRSSSPIFSDSPHRPPSVDRMRQPTQPQNPSHLNRAFDREQGPEQLSTFSAADPRQFQDRGRNSRAPSSQQPYRQPSFLNRGYERDQSPAQPRSFGDRGGRFVY